jgi:hypothetical protein
MFDVEFDFFDGSFDAVRNTSVPNAGIPHFTVGTVFVFLADLIRDAF